MVRLRQSAACTSRIRRRHACRYRFLCHRSEAKLAFSDKPICLRFKVERVFLDTSLKQLRLCRPTAPWAIPYVILFRRSRSTLAVCHDTNHQSTHHRGFSICGRGDGSGRGRRDGRGLGVTLGVPLAVALAVAVGVTEGVTDGVDVAVGVGLGGGVGVGVPPGSLKAYTLLSPAT
jgi:hypothetical protein